jgi:hypothetical protein
MKDIISENSTTQTSAFLIYNALKNSDHPLIEKFKISFPYEGVLVEESNVIVVAEANEEFDMATSSSDHYKALTEIYIKTKKADYKEVSKLLRSTRRAIKNVLKTDEDLRRMKIVFRNSSSKYGSKFALKASNILVQTNEIDFYNQDENISEFDVFFEDVEVNK